MMKKCIGLFLLGVVGISAGSAYAEEDPFDRINLIECRKEVIPGLDLVHEFFFEKNAEGQLTIEVSSELDDGTIPLPHVDGDDIPRPHVGGTRSADLDEHSDAQLYLANPTRRGWEIIGRVAGVDGEVEAVKHARLEVFEDIFGGDAIMVRFRLADMDRAVFLPNCRITFGSL